MTSKTCTLYVVRHGQSVANTELTSGGDTPLTEKGREQAMATKAKLADVTFDAAYSSNLKRALETAEIIIGEPVPKKRQIVELRERYFGVYEHQPYPMDFHDKMMTLTPEQRWRYRHGEGMENDEELVRRFLLGMERIAEKHLGGTVLVATHGGCVRTTLMKIAEAGHDELPPLSFKNAGYLKITYKQHVFHLEQVVGIDIEKAQIKSTKLHAAIAAPNENN
jgi:broad specificity phosphatase PhoE